VLVLELEGTLSLQADIDLRGKGFRGGLADISSDNNCSWLSFATAYAYAAGNWRGAAKGEGIARFNAGQESGRGPTANGGGGANDHNAGGGGGGHGQAGGQGGRNEEPATFGCSGPYPGLGGRAIGLQTERLFLGGGGGAGHENNNNGSPGGHGGGIVIIKAGSIQGQGHQIITDGMAATTATGDGAGGGGAGGSILLDCPGISDLQISARGADGGTVNNAGQARCMGPGGGGAGGLILLNSTDIVTTNTSPGNPGISSNSSVCPDGQQGAQAGNPGFTQFSNFSIPQSSRALPVAPVIIAQPQPTTACINDTTTLRIEAIGEDLGFQWQINTGAGFQPLSGPQADSVRIIVGPSAQVRVLISSPCFPSLMSDTISIQGVLPPNPAFSYTASANSVQFSSQHTGNALIQWHFGDGNQSNDTNPQHTYQEPGQYTVSLAVTNACGTQVVSQVIVVGQAPQANFSLSQPEACAPALIQFSDVSTGLYSTRVWSFPGGSPATDTAAQPLVLYINPGSYAVSLQLQGPQGSSTLSLPAALLIRPYPIPSFTYQQNANTVSFSNQSQNAISYTWLFGDGAVSQAVSPSHTYAQAGTYAVTLNAQTPFCASAYTVNISIQVTSSTTPLTEQSAMLYPNPFQDQLFFQRLSPNEDAWYFRIRDVEGREHMQGKLPADRVLQTSTLAPGMYLIQLSNRNELYNFKAIKS
jgi:PKD repeat protein